MSDSECGMAAGARRAAPGIAQTADLQGFSCTTISGVFREWSHKDREKKKKKSGGERHLCEGVQECTSSVRTTRPTLKRRVCIYQVATLFRCA